MSIPSNDQTWHKGLDAHRSNTHFCLLSSQTLLRPRLRFGVMEKTALESDSPLPGASPRPSYLTSLDFRFLRCTTRAAAHPVQPSPQSAYSTPEGQTNSSHTAARPASAGPAGGHVRLAGPTAAQWPRPPTARPAPLVSVRMPGA